MHQPGLANRGTLGREATLLLVGDFFFRLLCSPLQRHRLLLHLLLVLFL